MCFLIFGKTLNSINKKVKPGKTKRTIAVYSIVIILTFKNNKEIVAAYIASKETTIKIFLFKHKIANLKDY